MGSVEERIFTEHPDLKPSIYARYIDDIFISTTSQEEVLHLIQVFKRNSSLNFTHETEENQRLPFLDVLVHRNPTSFSTEVYVKSTNLGFCLNAASECPERYRRSVINAFVKRALTHCSSWTATNLELTRVSQMLANNGYPRHLVDSTIKHRLDTFMEEQEHQGDSTPDIHLYYKNYMSSAYSKDEKALRKIIHDHVQPIDSDTKLKLIIYYKTRRTSNLVMKNNCLPPSSPLQEVSLVYQYTCTNGDCSHLTSAYIGSTTTTLSKRITSHLQDGAIRRHNISQHGFTITRQHLEENTTIIHKEPDRNRLRITEAVYIHTHKPTINIQLQPETNLPSLRRPATMVRNHSSQARPGALIG